MPSLHSVLPVTMAPGSACFCLLTQSMLNHSSPSNLNTSFRPWCACWQVKQQSFTCCASCCSSLTERRLMGSAHDVGTVHLQDRSCSVRVLPCYQVWFCNISSAKG